MPAVYRVAPAVVARLMGLLLLALSVLVLLTTALVALLDLHRSALLFSGVLGVVVLAVAGATFWRRGWIVRMTHDGYRVQWVRGVGVDAARWKDVEDAVTTTVAGSPVVVLRLRSGQSTTIPVEMLACDREAFVRDLQHHLQQGQGLRPL